MATFGHMDGTGQLRVITDKLSTPANLREEHSYSRRELNNERLVPWNECGNSFLHHSES
jgi:hypothetical protein